MLCECHFRYADRAKSIAVKATKNEEGMEVEKLNKEIEALKRKVQAAVHSTSFYRGMNGVAILTAEFCACTAA